MVFLVSKSQRSDLVDPACLRLLVLHQLYYSVMAIAEWFLETWVGGKLFQAEEEEDI